MLHKIGIFWIVGSVLLEETLAADGNPEKCTDSQGRKVASGDRFFPGPFRLRPCTECLCVRGNAILCNMAPCIDHVNCTNPRWSATLCCNPECINQKRMIFSDLRNAVQNYNATPTRDYHPPYPTPNGFYDSSGSSSIFGMDDAGYIPAMNFDMFNGDPPGDANATLTGVTRTQNLPSPYYPILIGLISCAPVALCIICINALRKYFALRSQCSHGHFFSTRRRNYRARTTEASQPSPPTAYVDPPPAYHDLESPKYKLSEDLPKYEDVLKHDRQVAPDKIFATTSSARFQPPERVTFTYLPSAPTTSNSECLSSSSGPTAITVPNLVVGPSASTKPASEGIDNPAHEP